MNETYKIRKVGGALVVTIPQHLARIVDFNAGDDVRFTYTAAAQVIIQKDKPKRKTGAKR